MLRRTSTGSEPRLRLRLRLRRTSTRSEPRLRLRLMLRRTSEDDDQDEPIRAQLG